MSRDKKRGRSAPINKAVKDANAEARRLNEKTRELLSKAGKDVKQVRREVAALKKAGLVSPKVDTKTYRPTKYMLDKLKRNTDILTGKAVTIEAPKPVRDRYTATGTFEERQGRLVVPRDYENQKTRISRGLVEVTGQLQWGEERRIILPFKATDMQDVASQLQTDPTLDGLKNDDELFGFRLFGHSMATYGFPDAQMLAEYILVRYGHLFKGNNRFEGIRHFELIRFKAKNSKLWDGPTEEKIYQPRKKKAPKNDWLYQRSLRKEALRKQRSRENETPKQREERLDKQRIRQAILRQRKFDEK